MDSLIRDRKKLASVVLSALLVVLVITVRYGGSNGSQQESLGHVRGWAAVVADRTAEGAEAACDTCTTVASVGASEGPGSCSLMFDRYEPSALEIDWSVEAAPSVTKSTGVCDILLRADKQKWISPIQSWIDVGIQLDSKRVNAINEAKLLPKQVAMMQKASSSLSRMVYRDNCTGDELVTYTSPLAGTTRDPRGVCGDAVHPLRTEWLERGVQPNHAGSDLYSKEYILLDPSYLARVRRSLAPPPAAGTHPRNRAFLFDCGATTWGDGRGLAWLVNRYRDAGIEFDHIFGWVSGRLRTSACIGRHDISSGCCA